MRDFLSDLEERHVDARTGRTFDLEFISVEPVQVEQSAHDQSVDGHPHRPAPVRIATEHARVRLGGNVRNRLCRSRGVEGVRMRLVVLRHRSNSELAQEFVLVEHVAQDALEPLLRQRREQPTPPMANEARARRRDLGHDLRVAFAHLVDQLDQMRVTAQVFRIEGGACAERQQPDHRADLQSLSRNRRANAGRRSKNRPPRPTSHRGYRRCDPSHTRST